MSDYESQGVKAYECGDYRKVDLYLNMVYLKKFCYSTQMHTLNVHLLSKFSFLYNNLDILYLDRVLYA